MCGVASLERLRWSEDQLQLLHLPPMLWGTACHGGANTHARTTHTHTRHTSPNLHTQRTHHAHVCAHTRVNRHKLAREYSIRDIFPFTLIRTAPSPPPRTASAISSRKFLQHHVATICFLCKIIKETQSKIVPSTRTRFSTQPLAIGGLFVWRTRDVHVTCCRGGAER